MKTIKIILPTLALLFAIVGAFATQVDGNSSASATSYYEKVDASTCNTITCNSTSSSTACQQNFNIYSVSGCTTLADVSTLFRH